MPERVTARKSGGSLVVAVPAPYVRAWRLAPGDAVEVRLRRTVLEVRKVGLSVDPAAPGGA